MNSRKKPAAAAGLQQLPPQPAGVRPRAELAGLRRRLASMLYESLLLLGVLALTFLVCTIGVGSGGRTNMMLGVVQLVIFAAFLFLAVVP